MSESAWPPLQRVPASRHRSAPLFSTKSSSSLLHCTSTIGRFMETAGAPGMTGGKDQTPEVPSHWRKNRWETV
jgi:hypothetical protein